LRREKARYKSEYARRAPFTPGEKQLIILRGFPGAGKTMLAKEITERFGGHCLICSEDRYHWTGGDVGLGQFVFKPEINWQTRDWCAREVIDALPTGLPSLWSIISTTASCNLTNTSKPRHWY